METHVGIAQVCRKGPADMMSRIRRSMADRDQGFTLIELLVVIIIIGILAAIAIPVFLNQRKKAVDASIKSDLHNAAVIMETWTIDHPGASIPAIEGHAAPAATWGILQGLRLSPGNSLWVGKSAATVGGWCLFAYNANASEATGWPDMAWRSALGGLDPVIAANGTCA